MPDIILLDIEMPRMDGYEVAGHVRNDPRLADVPIIMITSRVGEKRRARAIELGVNDYLGKPYQEAQLLDAIAPLVEQHAVTRPVCRSSSTSRSKGPNPCGSIGPVLPDENDTAIRAEAGDPARIGEDRAVGQRNQIHLQFRARPRHERRATRPRCS